IPTLVERLGDENESVGRACGEALLRMGQVALPHLLNALKGGNDEARERVAHFVGRIRPISAEAIGALINALGDCCEKVRNSSANSLGFVRSALPALVSAMKNENEWVRAKSAYALGMMGVDAKEAEPALVNALRDPSRRVRSKSARALNR